MNQPPPYFETIRGRAEARWDQLERDPELAGPWHQLFQQIQSPRHVLSELLQNADDAGATEASVRVHDDTFVFEHNGEDFTEGHFASLCRFGYSNKRALHTIGFRGIGFKSTFSLGDPVELVSPTLSVNFHRSRFTQPDWTTTGDAPNGTTIIRVRGVEPLRQREVEKNFQEWLESPKSLLFFRTLRRITIGDESLHWIRLEDGPLPDSEWVALDGRRDEAVLLIRSGAEPFPEEALQEIRQERMLTVDEETEFPPCKVEIVMGGGGRLYVVLPTGVSTDLPFDCNAPFIQDPARVKIKDPETSPTNRWLLTRCGALAADAMGKWLGRGDLTNAERAAAYELFPQAYPEGDPLEESCAAIVAEAFSQGVENSPILLTDNGDVVKASEAIILPGAVFDVWTAPDASALLDEQNRPPLSREVGDTYKERLVDWRLLEEVDGEDVARTLEAKAPPTPETWAHLLNLWALVGPETAGHWRPPVDSANMHIVPVQGKDTLVAAKDAVRLGERRLLQADADWEFLSRYLLVVNPKWTRYLTDQRRLAEEEDSQSASEKVVDAHDLLRAIGLDDASNADSVLSTVAQAFFQETAFSLDDCIRLAQIAAKLGATVDEAFGYATRSGRVRPLSATILVDQTGRLENLIPESERDHRLLHEGYARDFTSCSKEEWANWVQSGRAGLHTFPPLVERESRPMVGRRLHEELERRGYTDTVEPTYKEPDYAIHDWDFDERYWRHWESLESEDVSVWATIAALLLDVSERYWRKKLTARVVEVARNGNTRPLITRGLVPQWAMRLRGKPCLRDTRGFPRKPEELLRRTPETESLIDVEPFVEGRIDTEANRTLLDRLGVRSAPMGPEGLLDRLRALAKSEEPPIHELEKWYRRLDHMLDTCSTRDAQTIKSALQSEKLIRTNEGTWATAKTVFRATDDLDLPGAELVLESLNDLALWQRIGVADRPTVEAALAWLASLPSRSALTADDLRRTRALLASHPLRIAEDCGHWISLAGAWTPLEELRFAITMQSLTPWQHLDPSIKQATADLRQFRGDIAGAPPFAGLSPLAAWIDERFSSPPDAEQQPEHKPWMATFGDELTRVELEDEDESERVWALGSALTATHWRRVPSGVEIIPYIDGKPAGTPRQADVAWIGETLYVGGLSKAKLAKRVPEEIGKAFGRADIKAALDYSFERAPADVREYLEENFQLAPQPVPEASPASTNTAETEASASSNTQPPASPDPAPAEAIVEQEGPGGYEPAPDGTDGHEPVPGATEGHQGDGGFSAPLEPTEPRSESATDTEEEPPPPTPKPRETKPNVMQRFARLHGFETDGPGPFTRPDGHTITRVSDEPLPWQHRDANGELVRCYWTKDHCLQREPLELEAEVWNLIEKYPETYALILTDMDGNPAEVTGDALVGMRQNGAMTLYPAAYRLVHENPSSVQVSE